MNRYLFDCGFRDTTASLGVFALRVMIGLMMLVGHGVPKIQGFSQMKDRFPVPNFFALSWMSPQVALVGCIIGEVVAASMIVLGIMTRPAAFLLGFTMVVAAFDVMGQAPWFVSPPKVFMAKELALLYLIPTIAIIFSGAGAYSLDAALYRDPKRRRW